ncbi:MAG: acyl-ACP--UDP-N-acetylglucosamine O-acyltransferase [Coxiellaceae bacterium]|nr:acyl-ACP--UDP-N-acetylglucosamine O-acyltransferase [Coxiellaceae bacterium]
MSDNPSLISSAAIIHPTAKIAEGVEIGPWVFIGENVEIGAGSRIEAHAVIFKNTTMGKNNRIHSHAVVGGDSQDLKYHGEEAWLKMGDNNTVREFVTINRGSDAGLNTTLIGNDNCFFACAHVAHDARIGNGVLFVNNAVVAGHVTVDDHAIIGAHSSVHQFMRIGAYSFLAQATQVQKDIPPFMMVTGIPGIPIGLNLTGLRRHGFSTGCIRGLKKAYQVMYRDHLPLKELEATLVDLAIETPEVQMIIDLMKASARGIVRKQVRDDESI